MVNAFLNEIFHNVLLVQSDAQWYCESIVYFYILILKIINYFC
jgi:hypothetical protein